MRVIILGSAAGGGVPQWNCGCRNCTEARHTNRSRTQSSVAVSADGERWILLNAPAGVTALLGDEWPLYRVLSAYSGVEPRALEEGRPLALTDRAGTPLGICCSATAVARRPPRYARAAPTQAFDVGLRLTDEQTGGTLAYVPTAGAMDD